MLTRHNPNTKRYTVCTFTFIISALWLSAGCGKKADDDSSNPSTSTTGSPTDDGSDPADQENAPQAGMIAINLTADGLGSAIDSAALRLVVPQDETYGYPGIGMNYGEAIVEGMKIQIQSIGLFTVNEENGAQGGGVTLVDFGKEGKELEISEGFNGKIEVTKDVAVPPGSYKQVSVTVDNAFSLKAYAYLDQNNDGIIDATVWTTATEVKIDTQKLAPGAMPGYDWYKYPWLIATSAKSLTDNSDSPSTITTDLPEAVVINEDGVLIGDSIEKSLAVTLLVDTFRIIKVWDGRYQAGGSWTQGSGDAATIPSPVFPFPQGVNDSRILSGSLKTYDFYPENKPAFALGNYLSAYGFVNKTSIKAQNYIISKTDSITPYNTQLMTVILDDDGTPMFAKMGLGESNETLHIGAKGKLFEKQPDSSYNFATSYGMKDAAGKWDGGLFYSDDIAKAGHLFTGFRKLAIGQRASMKMDNGPRCNDEYDYCVDAAGVTAYYLRAQ